jgi:hypothetical protein
MVVPGQDEEDQVTVEALPPLAFDRRLAGTQKGRVKS